MTATFNWNRFKRLSRPETVYSRSQEGYIRENEVEDTTHSASSSEGSSHKKKPKKNAFFMFMEEKRPQVEASGHKLKKGFAELAELLSDNWKALSKEERAFYEEKARKYNGTRIVVGAPAVSCNPGEDPDTCYLRTEKETWRQEFEMKRLENRALVWKMFETNDWMSTPIVVCSFSTFFDPDPLLLMEEFIPAEIGLTAFTLNDGVIDNFGRLIDPNDDIPEVRIIDASQRVEQMGLPDIGSCVELKKYDNLLGTIECFLEKYTGHCSDGYPLFALNSDLEMVTKCIDWICENAGRRIRFKVLSLSRWAQLASTSGDFNRQFRRPQNDDPADASTPRPTDSQLLEELQTATMRLLGYASNRVLGKSLTPVFFYPHLEVYPLTKYGIFLTEESVDDILRTNNNYTCYEELSCIYHMKRGDGVPYCALCISNRYAFYLLEFLTLSNRVKRIRRGYHFPAIIGEEETSEQRRERRLCSLGRWGLTELELNQKDVTLELQQTAKEEKNQKIMQGRAKRMEGQQRSTKEQGQEREPARQPPRLSVEANDAEEESVVRYEGGVRHPFNGDLPPVFRAPGLWKKK